MYGFMENLANANLTINLSSAQNSVLWASSVPEALAFCSIFAQFLISIFPVDAGSGFAHDLLHP